jgi:uncharacterized protein
MQARLDILVSDTGPLVALAKLNLLPQLHRVISRLYLPRAVFFEATQAGKPCAEELAQFVLGNPAWVICQTDIEHVLIDALSGRFGAGEVQAMYWARELEIPLLLDERRARAAAKELGLHVVGLGAVLLRCKQLGILPFVLPALRELEKLEYFLSPQVIKAIAIMADEQ